MTNMEIYQLGISSSSDLPDGRFELFNSEFSPHLGIGTLFYRVQKHFFPCLLVSSLPSCLQLQFSGDCHVNSIQFNSIQLLCRWVCANYDFFLLFIISIIPSNSLTLLFTSSLCTLSIQLIFSILLQHYISKASNLLISDFNCVQVSVSYNSTDQIKVLTRLFLYTLKENETLIFSVIVLIKS